MKYPPVLFRSVALLVFSLFCAGCAGAADSRFQEQSIYGMSMNIPSSWKWEFAERSGSVAVSPRKTWFSAESSRIMLLPSPVAENAAESDREAPLQETLLNDIRRIDGFLFHTELESPIIATGVPVESKMIMKKAILQIPTNPFPEESHMNFMGERRRARISDYGYIRNLDGYPRPGYRCV